MTDKTDSKKAPAAQKKAAPAAPAEAGPSTLSPTDKELASRWGYDTDRWGSARQG
jgi:hypothetical protein